MFTMNLSICAHGDRDFVRCVCQSNSSSSTVASNFSGICTAPTTVLQSNEDIRAFNQCTTLVGDLYILSNRSLLPEPPNVLNDPSLLLINLPNLEQINGSLIIGDEIPSKSNGSLGGHGYEFIVGLNSLKRIAQEFDITNSNISSLWLESMEYIYSMKWQNTSLVNMRHILNSTRLGTENDYTFNITHIDIENSPFWLASLSSISGISSLQYTAPEYHESDQYATLPIVLPQLSTLELDYPASIDFPHKQIDKLNLTHIIGLDISTVNVIFDSLTIYNTSIQTLLAPSMIQVGNLNISYNEQLTLIKIPTSPYFGQSDGGNPNDWLNSTAGDFIVTNNPQLQNLHLTSDSERWDTSQPLNSSMAGDFTGTWQIINGDVVIYNNDKLDLDT